jgi:RNA polymerase sigma-70 factor (ECF subfamily)
LEAKIQFPMIAGSQERTLLAPLIERAALGDIGAFEQIMIHSQQKVLTLTWRMLGNEADARDASQEVFLRVYKYLRRFDQQQDFFAWLYRITVNVCRDVAKSRRKLQDHITRLGKDEEDYPQLVPGYPADAVETLEQNQQRLIIARAVSKLPQKERMAIVLRDFEGLSTNEVARIMNSTPATVRSQISSARKKLMLYCERYLRKER